MIRSREKARKKKKKGIIEKFKNFKKEDKRKIILRKY